MKREIKALVISIIALAFLTASYFIVKSILPESDSDSKKIRLISGNPDDMQLVTVIYPEDNLDGYKYVIAKVQDGDKNDFQNVTYLYFDDGIDDDYVYSQGALKQAFTRLMALEATSLVVSETDDLTQYGLDNESAVFVSSKPWEGKDVQEVKLLIGDYNDIYSGYYAKFPDKPEVYLISSSDGNTYVDGSIRYRFVDIIPNLGEQYEELKTLTLTNMYGEEIVMKHHETYESEVEGKIIYSMFGMLQPYTAYVSDEVLFDKVIDPLLNSSVVRVIKNDPSEDELKACGFDTPCSIKLELKSFTRTFKIGIPGGDPALGAYYMMLDDENSIYEVFGSASFAPVKPLELLSTLVWAHSIKNVDTVEINIPSGSYVLEIDDRTTDDGGGVFFASLNGKAISEDNARYLYKSVISVAYDDIMADKLLETTPSYKLKITYKSGFTETVSFYKVTSRQYAVLFNNAPLEDAGFCVNIKGLREISENIDTILSGGTIER